MWITGQMLISVIFGQNKTSQSTTLLGIFGLVKKEKREIDNFLSDVRKCNFPVRATVIKHNKDVPTFYHHVVSQHL